MGIFLALLFAVAVAVAVARGQGILTVTPTRTASTVANNGTVGDSGASTSATVAHPGAVA